MMNKNFILKSFATGILASVFAFSSIGQNNVDIGIYQNEGNIEVKVKPHIDFDGLFSAVVFTIRWDENTGASLGDIAAPNGTELIPMMKSGGVHDAGVYNYQVFSGVGFQSLDSKGMTWEAENEYTIMTIPYNGSADFELVNDSWTSVPEHNADYYVSLGGRDETGIIYKRSTGMASSLEGSLLIQPNPNNGIFSFSFVAPEKSDLGIELVNTLGQSVYSTSLNDFSGEFRKDMDLSSESKGVYYLNINNGEETSVHKIVVN